MLVFGKEPVYLHYDNSKMRMRLLNCIRNCVFIEFPSIEKQRKNLYYPIHTIQLHCTCRMPRVGPTVSMHGMSTMVSSAMPRNQTESAPAEEFNDS